jgi:HPt (histidine-containing phosphotransfer) domain-containing protein
MRNFETHPQRLTITAPNNLFDLGMLEEMEDNEYLLEVLNIFLDEAPADLNEMKQAAGSGNTAIVCKKAHKLKGSAGVIQAEILMSMLAEIEAIGKKGIVDGEMNSLIENAGEEYRSIEKALKNYIAQLSS